VFNSNVRAQQLISHVKTECLDEYRRHLAAKTAHAMNDKAAGAARIEKLKDYIETQEAIAAARDEEEVPSDDVEQKTDEADETENSQQQQLQKLKEELAELESEQERCSFILEKATEAQALLADGGSPDLFLNGNLLFLEQGGSRYAAEAPEKGSPCIAIEPQQRCVNSKVSVVIVRAADSFCFVLAFPLTRYTLFLGEQPVLFPETPDDEKAFASKFKPKNLVRFSRVASPCTSDDWLLTSAIVVVVCTPDHVSPRSSRPLVR